MSKSNMMYADDFKAQQSSIVLLYGEFEKDFFSMFAERTGERFFVMEGRPTLSAGQKCCSGLAKLEIRPTLICDNMAGFLFAKGMVKEVWLSYVEEGHRGALCLIGSSILGLLAKKHHVPVYLYQSSIKKPKLMADANELIYLNGTRVAPKDAETYVPLLEWVPGKCLSHE